VILAPIREQILHRVLTPKNEQKTWCERRRSHFPKKSALRLSNFAKPTRFFCKRKFSAVSKNRSDFGPIF